ncbi:MAG: Hsp20/alpha crystallin family protein [Candidatus Margulisiibacteriota bacterium]|nr:MAG: hypothetical protein A2X43_09680 [Candidatus Margulisbacteria bacterium GWD2_39_127]OGI04605.1 MAG: hypothetical protein A2X42_07850 [Candidatus Margulisbacteria bacterium GWF2_38_17]OGI11863.1 MAG: hypothetical protein A2X41_11420 [Candidatus Margulisbacteria bacterium GWE2_39_32]PZM83126.1 MAG: Hsp20/alpha crystallin family protein [Candidatus Margulisiibacteriota bacterium]HAR62205.1 Hsp20/alpha crystallin family protein [Candidatus Margulisiibacteriota bacterium]
MLTLWKPRSLARMESLFDDYFQERDINRYLETNFSPDIDIKETPNSLLIEAELPGMEKKDIRITYEQGALKISGEKKMDTIEENELHHRVERTYGKFQRIIPLDEEYIKPDQIKAEMINGLLKIEMPKVNETVGKEVNIEVK